MPTRADEQTWTIAQVADEFGITHRTVRHYEDLGLISPERHGTKRLYRRRDRARLQLILRGKRFGFSLEDIRQLLDMYDRSGSNVAQLQRTYALAEERLSAMERQRAELDEAISELRAEMAKGAAEIEKFSAGG